MLLGLDIGGTKLAAVVGSENGEVLHRAQAPTPTGAGWRSAYDILIALARQTCRDAQVLPPDAAGVGVSCGGPLDIEAGVVLDPPNLPDWRNVPLVELLRADLATESICLDNDANATALAEHRWGAGQRTRNMAYLTFGTGIGAGLILDGAVYRGKRNLAGEIGHATVDPNGPLCLCGKRGCLEAMASGGALDRMARAYFGDPTASAARICELARGGDAGSLEIVDGVAKALGIGIANLLQTLDLEMVVLGSLAVKSGDLFLGPVRRYVVEYTWPSIAHGVAIVPAGLGAEAQDKAALALASIAAANHRRRQ